MKCAYYSLIYYNVREVQNISSKLINQAAEIYCYNLGDKLSYPKNRSKIILDCIIPLIEIGVYIYLYIYIYIYMTFCERLIYSMNVLPMTMVSYYLHTSPR